ncbi:hypothetical protein CEXT_683621 [Caerostris extrusa]|uniref:Uncharacterized protein n=1 Tax=Caerostris extrusa TaxID=172846 RepID=A0AAV4PP18_CAEEX|nr:hypothetical protein CEXT_683621 [Caerostris extrusa]
MPPVKSIVLNYGGTDRKIENTQEKTRARQQNQLLNPLRNKDTALEKRLLVLKKVSIQDFEKLKAVLVVYFTLMLELNGREICDKNYFSFKERYLEEYRRILHLR